MRDSLRKKNLWKAFPSRFEHTQHCPFAYSCAPSSFLWIAWSAWSGFFHVFSIFYFAVVFSRKANERLFHQKYMEHSIPFSTRVLALLAKAKEKETGRNEYETIDGKWQTEERPQLWHCIDDRERDENEEKMNRIQVITLTRDQSIWWVGRSKEFTESLRYFYGVWILPSFLQLLCAYN